MTLWVGPLRPIKCTIVVASVVGVYFPLPKISEDSSDCEDLFIEKF